MALTWAQKRQLVKFFQQSIRDHPGRPVLVSEGDSWFSFPLYSNIVDLLDSRANRRLSLLRLERSADELLQILSGKQKVKLRRYLGEYPVQALLLSGGGNDVAGRDLYHLLRDKAPGRDWEQSIHKDRVRRRIRQLELAHREVIDIRDDVNPDCVIYTHGYDWAIPTGKGVRIFGAGVGPWLQPNLEERGIVDGEDQRLIVRWLIDAFNEMHQRLAQEHPKIAYIDLRGTLDPGDWHDELHPKRDGFKALAEKFAERLSGQFPSVFS